MSPVTGLPYGDVAAGFGWAAKNRQITEVASSASDGGSAPRSRPDRLDAVMQYPLLHDSECAAHVSGEDWSHWLAYVGRPDLRCDIGQHFSNAVLTLGAAAAGLGVALGRRSLIEDDLASGRLVPAWPVAAPTIFAYWLVCLPERLDTSHLAAFRGWLLDEVQAYTASTQSLVSF